jgi:uncharacterized protein (UPF0264 family)
VSIRLLVSVRNVDEAASALSGGADIVDVKEPGNGALGKASDDHIQSIIDYVAAHSTDVPVSAALGECTDWQQPTIELNSNGHDSAAGTVSAANVSTSVSGLTYVKLGLANILKGATDGTWREWRQHYGHTCKQLASQFTAPTVSLPPSAEAPRQMPEWVSVAYADFVRAEAPAPEQVLEGAIADGSPVLLLDTFIKDHTSLLDWTTDRQLLRLRQATRQHQIQLALAGRLSQHHLAQVRQIAPDIIAVRGAVCEGSDRQATVSADRVRQLRELISS